MKMQPSEGRDSEWNEIIRRLPSPHLLQTWEWAEVKAAYGWQPMPFIWVDPSGRTAAAAMVLKKQILRRSFAARACILYVPKGPLLDWSNAEVRRAILADLRELAQKEHAVFIKIDPDVILGIGIPGAGEAREEAGGSAIRAELQGAGWLFASDQIQFRNSVWLSLTESEDEILARMGQKTRYNIRLAGKKGVTVRKGQTDDLSDLYKMYAETSARDGFVIREEAYYRQVWSTFMQNETTGRDPAAEVLIAEVEDERIAALFLFRFAGRAYYLYGMSRQAHREKMPNHLLQWEAIKRAKARGCKVYDLWGAPDSFSPSDPMWGVFRFKEGLGGEVVRTLGAWDRPGNALWYRLYTTAAPRLLDVMRRRGRDKTRRELEAA